MTGIIERPAPMLYARRVSTTCQACGAEQAPGAKFCRSCGVALGGVACPKCHAPQVAGARFCRECGAPLEPEPGPICPHCHAAQIPGARFCRQCGASLSDKPPVPAESPDEPMVASDPIQGVVAKALQGKNLLTSIRQDPTRLLQPAKGKLNWMEALAVAIVVALLAFFALFGVWRFGFAAMLTSGVTPLLVYLIGFVLSMVIFRGLLDRLLRPVYGFLGRLSVPIRLTMGLLAPAAWCLWDSKDWGSGFYHAGQTITIATLLGHVLLRSTEHQAPPPSPRVQQAVMLMGFLLLLRHLGWADDCSSPEDAMDTWYVGPPVKGLVSTVIAVSVNGKTILTKWLKPAKPPEDDSPPPYYRLNASSQDRRTDLVLDGTEGLWVYAWISVTNPPPGYDAAAATEAIGFSAPECLQLSEPQLAGSRKAVHVRAVTPSSGEAPASATLVCSATLSGQPVVAPMPFELQGGYEMVVTTSSEWSS